MRITQKNLDAVVARINRATGGPEEPYTHTDNGRYVANIGNYHLSYAYGGVSLHYMVDRSGGIRDVFGCGHTTKSDLFNRMQAYLHGIESTLASNGSR